MKESCPIDIATAGKFHAFRLASELAAMSRLRDLYSSHRSLRPPIAVSRRSFHNRIDLVAWGVLSRFAPIGYSLERKAEIFDRWLSRRLLGKSPGVLHSWNGNSYETFKSLKGSGWLLCVERSCPHNQYQFDLLVEEGKEIGIPYRQDMGALERAIEELHLADVIVVPSSYSAGSYGESALSRKVRVNALGSNVRYVERTKKRAGFKVLMVGNNFLRKGTHYLIEAFKRLDDPKAELWIRGDVPEEYRKRVRDSRITIVGNVLPEKLKEMYQSADVFVQPSIDEGFGMTVFEALAYGLPLVVTENVGAKDVLTPEVAVRVPIRNPEALGTAIEAARRLPGREFDLARKSILEENTWGAYARRMVDSVYVS